MARDRSPRSRIQLRMKSVPRVMVASSALLLALAEAPAFACGVSGPDGAACSISEHEEETRPKWRVGASGIATGTSLRFSGGLRVDQTRYAALGSIGYMPTPRLALSVGAGAAIGGEIVSPTGTHDFRAGPIGSLSASWRVVDEQPFVVLTSVLSFQAATTVPKAGGPAVGYEAIDLRLGAIAGVTLFDALSPYALTRVFGGPVYWRYLGDSVTGTDVYHYQVGAGIAVKAAKRVSAFVEGVPLGERSIALGATVAF